MFARSPSRSAQVRNDWLHGSHRGWRRLSPVPGQGLRRQSAADAGGRSAGGRCGLRRQEAARRRLGPWRRLGSGEAGVPGSRRSAAPLRRQGVQDDADGAVGVDEGSGAESGGGACGLGWSLMVTTASRRWPKGVKGWCGLGLPLGFSRRLGVVVSDAGLVIPVKAAGWARDRGGLVRRLAGWPGVRRAADRA